jgi:hypothetical protein
MASACTPVLCTFTRQRSDISSMFFQICMFAGFDLTGLHMCRKIQTYVDEAADLCNERYFEMQSVHSLSTSSRDLFAVCYVLVSILVAMFYTRLLDGYAQSHGSNSSATQEPGWSDLLSIADTGCDQIPAQVQTSNGDSLSGVLCRQDDASMSLDAQVDQDGCRLSEAILQSRSSK